MDVIVGGGVVGLSAAWRLARAGRPVTVVDPAPASGASHAAAGMLAPVSEVTYTEAPLLRLGVASLRRWPAFAAELAADAGLAGTRDLDLRADGTLDVAFGSDDLAALDELAAYMEKLELPVERLTGRECRRLEPMLAPSVRGGLLAPGDAWVDPRRVTAALLAALDRLEVPLVRARVAELLRDGDRVVGVRLEPPGDTAPSPGTTAPAATGEGGSGLAGQGTSGLAGPSGATGQAAGAWDGWSAVAAEGVNAGAGEGAGAGSGERAGHGGAWEAGRTGTGTGTRAGGRTAARAGIAGGPGEIRGERVLLAAGAWSAGLAEVPVRPVKGQIMRLRSPQPLLTRCVRGTVHGTPVYLVPRGDGELVVGATQEELGFDRRVTAGGLYELLRDARELVPGVTELEVADVVAGLRPGTPDNLPLVGPSGTPGLALATGHFRGGVLMAPLTADILLGEEGELAALCAPGRFREIS
ncbi:FAD-dependent oxidoreductase [Nonomuraea phyllanthi]|uniref:FAD-dependent oxidoreductase n=1 Tax=Nonomuraea phyllanthi TaxID=2219224 RepID=UPI001D14BCD5|nr:FAD-dependent oxidoreductase [Nonomuraea phyllanthi]